MVVLPYSLLGTSSLPLGSSNWDIYLENEHDNYQRFGDIMSNDGQLGQTMNYFQDEFSYDHSSIHDIHQITNGHNLELPNIFEEQQNFISQDIPSSVCNSSFDDAFFLGSADVNPRRAYRAHHDSPVLAQGATPSPLDPHFLGFSAILVKPEVYNNSMTGSLLEDGTQSFDEGFQPYFQEDPEHHDSRAGSSNSALTQTELEPTPDIQHVALGSLYHDSSMVNEAPQSKREKLPRLEIQSSRRRRFSGDSILIPSPAVSHGHPSEPSSALSETAANLSPGIATPESDVVEEVPMKNETAEENSDIDKSFNKPSSHLETVPGSDSTLHCTDNAQTVGVSEISENEDSTTHEILLKGILAFESPNRQFSRKFFDHILATRELTGKTIDYLKRKQAGKKPKAIGRTDKREQALRTWRHKPFRCRFANCIMSHVGLGRGPLLAAHIAAGHLEAQSLTCNFCNRDFSRTDALRRHYRVVHHDEEFTSSKDSILLENNPWKNVHSLLARAAAEAIKL